MAGMKDVAEMAGVSLTTVSHVINGTRPVHPGTVARVEEAVRALGYRPSRAAQALRKQRSWNIGVIDCSMNNQFFLETMQKSHVLFEELGYQLTYSFLEPEPEDESSVRKAFERESTALESLLRKDVEVVILDSVLPDEELKELLKQSPVPVVLFQREFKNPPTFSVCSDDYQGGRLAADHLLELGHRRIAVVEGFSYESHATKRRGRGILDRLAGAGIQVPPDYWKINCYVSEEAYSQTRELIQLPKPPTAILYFSDIQAIVGIRAIADAGLRVPQDISVVGYDNVQLARWTLPRLTTVHQDTRALASLLVDACQMAIAEPASAGHLPPLPVSLVSRESSSAPAGSRMAQV